ncbi:OLC1v1025714C1 [Oldenlandia corymbosa var. corymbosa]|uniref:OLC1v1025714C1 n=1 Tax=Oldenlandia corymbosa var. corymbosa TaxID=529605 RepID=A0AAV1C5D2_OLDCO|nr:OLC1v1025714C1 [Oldenlandia corymbosa var. corymbosa]
MVVIDRPQFSTASTGRRPSPDDNETLVKFQERQKQKRNDRRSRKEKTLTRPSDPEDEREEYPKNYRKGPNPHDEERLAEIEAELKKELHDLIDEEEACRTLTLLKKKKDKHKVPGKGEAEGRRETSGHEASQIEFSATPGATFWDSFGRAYPAFYTALEQFAKEHRCKKQSRDQHRQGSPSVELLSKKDWDPPLRGNVHSRLGPRAFLEMSYRDHHYTYRDTRHPWYGRSHYDDLQQKEHSMTGEPWKPKHLHSRVNVKNDRNDRR